MKNFLSFLGAFLILKSKGCFANYGGDNGSRWTYFTPGWKTFLDPLWSLFCCLECKVPVYLGQKPWLNSQNEYRQKRKQNAVTYRSIYRYLAVPPQWSTLFCFDVCISVHCKQCNTNACQCPAMENVSQHSLETLIFAFPLLTVRILCTCGLLDYSQSIGANMV